MSIRFIVGSFLLLFSFAADAKKFRTDFISLELPPAWDCVKEEIDWVCQPDNLAQRSEAIVVIVAKNVNPVDDNFEAYEAILKEPRDMRDLLGNAYKSEVKYVRFKEIRNHKWIDSLTYGSEIPGFFTRYVASIKGKVAGLVTYSIAESVYAKWAPILDKMLDSLELHFDPKAFNDAMNASPASLLGQRANTGGRFAPIPEDESEDKKAGGDFDLMTIGGLILLVGGLGYWIWKKRQKQI
jgi:LPXTG-motif cell wall-anchored protein